MTDSFKYRAFISYSHKDEAWATWLHRAIERYRVPRRLVGRTSRDGSVPRRLFPIFRDREELPTSADLGATIREALRASRYLIVICSPAAAQSRWVNEEIATFKALVGEGRVLCLIVDGEPNASDRGEGATQECFPEALRFRSAAPGEVRERAEPIAADARRGKDGRADALLKMIAGLLGVDYDELKQRDRRRRRWRRVRFAAAVFVAALLVAVVAAYIDARDSRERYHDAGVRELMNERPDRAAPYLAAAYGLGKDDPLLRLQLGHALRTIDIKQALVAGHEAGVLAIRFSDDGTNFVSASADRTARVWTAAGRPLQSLRGHTDSVVDAAFDADGRRIVTSSLDGTVVVWDAASGRRQLTIAGAGGGTAVFAPDGRRIVTAAHESVHVWDAASGAQLHAFPVRFTFGLILDRASFDRGGERLVLPGPGPSARVWDLATGEARVTMTAEDGVVLVARYDEAGERIVTAGDQAIVWDARTGDRLKLLQGHEGRVVDAVFGPEGQLATASWDGTAKLWDTDYTVRNSLGGHRPNLKAVRFGQAAGVVVTHDATGVKIWDASSGRLRAEYETGPFLTAIAPDVDLVASPTDRAIRLLIVPDNGWLGGYPTTGALRGFSASSDRLAVADRRRVAIWDPAAGQTTTLTEAAVTAIELSADGRRAMTIEEGAVRVWDVRESRTNASFTPPVEAGGFASGMLRGSLSPDGRRAAIVGTGRNATVWDAETGTRLLALSHVTHDVGIVRFDPTGGTLVTAASRGLHLWDASGRGLASADGQGGFIERVTFSADGRLLASVDDQGVVRIWDAPSLRIASSLRNPVPAVAAAFHPRMALVATAHTDGRVRFWELPSGRAVFELDAAAPGRSSRDRPIHDLAFSGDGLWLAVAMAGQVDLWETALEDRPPAAVARAVRCLAPWQIRGGRLEPAPLSDEDCD